LSALLRDVAAGGVGVLLVDHDLDLMFAVADVVYAMAGGRVVAYGTPDEVRADETVRATYLDPVIGGTP
jgi:branched-chain amino acid transport system ATP-binding protein